MKTQKKWTRKRNDLHVSQLQTPTLKIEDPAIYAAELLKQKTLPLEGYPITLESVKIIDITHKCDFKAFQRKCQTQIKKYGRFRNSRTLKTMRHFQSLLDRTSTKHPGSVTIRMAYFHMSYKEPHPYSVYYHDDIEYNDTYVVLYWENQYLAEIPWQLRTNNRSLKSTQLKSIRNVNQYKLSDLQTNIYRISFSRIVYEFGICSGDVDQFIEFIIKNAPSI